MRRRDFVGRLPAVTGLLAGAAGVPLSACAGAAYVVARVEPTGLVVPVGSVGESGAFVQAPGMERPIWVGRDERGELVALLAVCTHRGCQPEPVGDRLVCPCHGSEFSRTGAVLEGPAERPLTRYDVELRGEEVVVRVPTAGVDR